MKLFLVKLNKMPEGENRTLLVVAESKRQAERIAYQNVDYTWIIDSTEETTQKVFYVS